MQLLSIVKHCLYRFSGENGVDSPDCIQYYYGESLINRRIDKLQSIIV